MIVQSHMFKVAAIAALLFAVSIADVSAHSGGTDSNGCHHNWKDGSGRYHCH